MAAAEIRPFPESLATPPELPAIGEPTHGEPAFPRLRNEVLPAPGGPDPHALAERIRSLPDVTHVQVDAGSGVPEVSWGDRFFFLGADRMRPFATIVEHDVPGFDEDSRLDRPGVFRLNVHLGRDEFRRRFGYPPAEFATHRPGLDFSRLDELLPHPAYGQQGWACVLNPSERLLDGLVAAAHGWAVDMDRKARDLRTRRAGSGT